LSKSLEYDSNNSVKVWSAIKHATSIRNKLYNWVRVAAVLFPFFILLTYIFMNKSETDQFNVIDQSRDYVAVYGGDGRVYFLTPDDHEQKNDDSLLYLKKSTVLHFDSLVAKIEGDIVHKIVTPKGVNCNLVFNDGTSIGMNAQSELEFLSLVSSVTRNVKMTGELYFDVAHNANKPFTVEYDNVKVTVLGTEFNVKAYENDLFSTTSLITGKVEIINKGKDKMLLNPGFEARLLKDSNLFKCLEFNEKIVCDWRRDEFSYDSHSLDFIMKDLARWYDFEYVFLSEDVKTHEYTFDVSRSMSLDQIINMLRMTGEFECNVEDGKIVIY
ncbi:MAG: FecR family protein, partial [Bacteroidales bacterium]|nr:FecR family protein [Bacteroidales bacterium]